MVLYITLAGKNNRQKTNRRNIDMDISRKILIKDLMRETEEYLLGKGYRKSTLGVYKATWNRFAAFSASEYYDRKKAEAFLLQYFGIDVRRIDQKLDMRMRHALRHMNSLEEFAQSGSVCRRKIRSLAIPPNEKFNLFFIGYLNHQKQCGYSGYWVKNTEAALKIFLLAVQSVGITGPTEIDADTIRMFDDILSSNQDICANTRRERCRKVGAYLNWLYQQKITEKDFSLLLPNIRRTPPALPIVWSEGDIERILDTIDTANPVGKRNYAIFLLLARTGLRISDVVSLQFDNIHWSKNCIQIIQQKTGNMLSIPLSKEIGMAIVSYLKYGRPVSGSPYVFLGHNAPFEPLHYHNNFYVEMKRYMRRAGIVTPQQGHTGVHSIRHSFATNLLKKGASVENISQILGHSDINVTETYLRVDIEQLRLCALELEDVQ